MVGAAPAGPPLVSKAITLLPLTESRIAVVNGISRLAAGACILGIAAQEAGLKKWTPNNPPRFDDFPVKGTRHGPNAPVKLRTRSERMFTTNLKNAGKGPPNFAGRYRMTYWGCGSFCSAGALIELPTGEVFQPPLAEANGSGWMRWITCATSFEGTEDEFHLDSRS